MPTCVMDIVGYYTETIQDGRCASSVRTRSRVADSGGGSEAGGRREVRVEGSSDGDETIPAEGQEGQPRERLQRHQDCL